MNFFEQTSDPIINTIKKDLFEVADGKPIVGPEHHVIKDMMALPPRYANGVHPSSHARAHLHSTHARVNAERQSAPFRTPPCPPSPSLLSGA